MSAKSRVLSYRGLQREGGRGSRRRYLGGNPLPFRFRFTLPIEVKVASSGIVFRTLPDQARECILLLTQRFALLGDALCRSPELIDGHLDVVLGDALDLG